MFTLMCVLQIFCIPVQSDLSAIVCICCCYYWNDAWYKSCARTAMLN
nr:ORF128b [Helicoverpa SNPV AC53]WIV86020.1 ORF128b [Helicoverpa SNPV AC53]WIV86439.1 ORF128b [Helicoverpa SNPV AC53]